MLTRVALFLLMCGYQGHWLSRCFTSTRLFLLFLDAGSDGVVLLVHVLASSDPAENLTALLAPALLEEPAGTLRQEEEADELQHGRDNGQTQHVPAVQGEEMLKDSRWGLKTRRGLGGHYTRFQDASAVYNSGTGTAQTHKWGCLEVIHRSETWGNILGSLPF